MMIPTNLLSSKKGLEQLCNSQPRISPKTTWEKIRPLAYGVGAAGYFGVCGYGLFGCDDQMPRLLGGTFGLMGLIYTFTNHGEIISFFDELITKPFSDGKTFYHNYRPMNRYRRSDRWFGELIAPVEDLQNPEEGLVFINGAYVSDVKIEETLERVFPRGAHGEMRTGPILPHYKAEGIGSLGGHERKISVEKSTSKDLCTKLKSLADSHIYLLARAKAEPDSPPRLEIELDYFGEAYTE